MQLKRLKATLLEMSLTLKAAEDENDRLKGVITEMDYDRIAWADHILSEQERSDAAASSCGLPVPQRDPSEKHVYCTVLQAFVPLPQQCRGNHQDHTSGSASKELPAVRSLCWWQEEEMSP